eukprot:TRINITY_DN9632_c0_g1_i5.p1 TRINITY_DN9632_c0_g1~~TRINITY_DN9632_c0_g1_i5.p1  ORF type:complete len:220 (+),score=43.31 TRINITY_DN9632_c0_g1_i5:110-769(+)
MIRRPPRSTLSSSSAASDVYKRQYQRRVRGHEHFTMALSRRSLRRMIETAETLGYSPRWMVELLLVCAEVPSAGVLDLRDALASQTWKWEADQLCEYIASSSMHHIQEADFIEPLKGSLKVRHLIRLARHETGYVETTKRYVGLRTLFHTCKSVKGLSLVADGWSLNQRAHLLCALVDDRMNNILSLIHISEPTRLLSISYAVFCLKKKKIKQNSTNTK